MASTRKSSELQVFHLSNVSSCIFRVQLHHGGRWVQVPELGDGAAEALRSVSSADATSAGLAGDYLNIGLLLVLYTLQGVPMGLAGAIPFILQEKGVSYADQSMFSLVSWPFSLKLFWAPIIDSVYVEAFGRRKSWLVPSQLMIGLTMLMLGSRVDAMLSETVETAGEKPQVQLLTATFFWMFFLCATQDIAVDGWALTMLQERWF